MPTTGGNGTAAITEITRSELDRAPATLERRRVARVRRAGVGIVGGGEHPGARRDRQGAARVRASSAHVASTLQLALQHEEDLIVSARGFAAGNPNASNTEFIRWATSVQVLQRYPELVEHGLRADGPPSAAGCDRCTPPELGTARSSSSLSGDDRRARGRSTALRSAGSSAPFRPPIRPVSIFARSSR